MPATNHQNGTSQAAIFLRLWETEDGKLPRTLARIILKLGFPKYDKARMHELALKNQEGQITPSELEELDNYIKAGDLLAILQSKARSALKGHKRAPARHG
jgi:S-adenosylmethionine:tRNA-ribosyltransferase-isomerase (queuine synthetase)